MLVISEDVPNRPLRRGRSGSFICKFSVDSQFQQLRHQMMLAAQMASLMVDGDALMKIQNTPPILRLAATSEPAAVA